jgi:hypothetical protein
MIEDYSQNFHTAQGVKFRVAVGKAELAWTCLFVITTRV